VKSEIAMKTEMHRILKPHLDKKGLSFMQQVILVEDLGTALQKQIEVFQSHNNGNHQNSEAKAIPEPIMYLKRNYE